MVLTNALEEAWLNQVIGDFLGHREPGGIWRFSDDVDAIRPLIPRFAVVVKDMVQRELVELVFTAHYQDWPNTPSLTMAEVDTALADLDTWMPPDGAGPIMLISGDETDRLMGRRLVRQPRS